MSAFFSRLSYSFGNEDSDTERLALKIKPSDRVLCITASGDRPLHLLLDECEEVVSIDANSIQNHLLNLKIAAMQQLEYDQYLSFLGASPCKNRRDTLPKLLKVMDRDSSQYWQRNEQAIASGVLYQGAMEQWAKRISRVVRGLRGTKVRKLFSTTCLETQKKFIEKDWDRYLWKKAFDLALNPTISRFILKDPGLYAHVHNDISPGTYIYHRLNACLMHSLARENPLLSLLFKGRVEKDAFPPYLTKEGYQIIRRRVDRVTTRTTDLITYLESLPENSFNAFSLSDVASYISENDFRRLLYAVYRTARPGARFSIREFLSAHQIPHELKPFFKREPELEMKLEKSDRCFVYRFMVGHIETP